MLSFSWKKEENIPLLLFPGEADASSLKYGGIKGGRGNYQISAQKPSDFSRNSSFQKEAFKGSSKALWKPFKLA